MEKLKHFAIIARSFAISKYLLIVMPPPRSDRRHYVDELSVRSFVCSSIWSFLGLQCAVVKAACLESRRSRGRTPLWPPKFKRNKMLRFNIVGRLRDREVACSASDHQGSNFEFCVWRAVSSQSSHHPQEVLLAQFSLYVYKGGLKPHSFHFICNHYYSITAGASSCILLSVINLMKV